MFSAKRFSAAALLLVTLASFLGGCDKNPFKPEEEKCTSAPNAPTVLSATRTSDSTIVVCWLDNSDNEDSFQTFMGIGPASYAGLREVKRNATQATIILPRYMRNNPDLKGGGYEVVVYAVNKCGSGKSNTIIFIL